MSCPQEKFIKAWLDGELDRDRAAALDRHTAECAACRAAFADYRQISERLRVLALESPPPFSIEKVIQGAERQRREEVLALRVVKRVCLAAAAILIAATAGLLVPIDSGRPVAAAEGGLDDVMAVALVEPPFAEDF